MATLSTKVPAKLAEEFEQVAQESDVSTSRMLRSMVELAVHYRRFEVEDYLVAGPNEGVLFVRWDAFLDGE